MVCAIRYYYANTSRPGDGDGFYTKTVSNNTTSFGGLRFSSSGLQSYITLYYSSGSSQEILLESTSSSQFTITQLSLTGDCAPPPITYYDCINGACLPKTTYNTPGIYASLLACEEVCGTGCSGKCISNADWAAIEALAQKHLQQDCGG